MIFLNIIFYSTGYKRSRKPFDMRFFSDEDFFWPILVMLLLVIIANGNRGTAEKVTLAIKLCVCPSYSTRLHSFPTSNIIIIIFTTFQYFFLYFQYSTVFFSILPIPLACTAFRPAISSSLFSPLFSIFLYFQYFTVFFSILPIPTACIAFRPVISSSLLAVSLTIKSAMISKIIEYRSLTVSLLFSSLHCFMCCVYVELIDWLQQ